MSNKTNGFSTEKKDSGFSIEKKNSKISSEKKDSGFSIEKKNSKISSEKKDSGFSIEKKNSKISSEKKDSSASSHNKSDLTINKNSDSLKEKKVISKSNQEKLQILHNRLDEISEKQAQANKNIEVKEENFSENIPTSNKKNFKLKTYLIRVFIIVGVFLILKNLNLKNIDFKGFLSEKEDAKTDMVNDKQEDTNIIYNLNSKGVSYILAGEYDSEEQAIQQTDKIKSVLGNTDFEIEYKFIPNISNSNFQIYKTLIGPFTLESEAKQWRKIIGEKSELINL